MEKEKEPTSIRGARGSRGSRASAAATRGRQIEKSPSKTTQPIINLLQPKSQNQVGEDVWQHHVVLEL